MSARKCESEAAKTSISVRRRAPVSTNEGSLWGGRFADGPSDALAALSKSTHFDWVLAPYDVAASKAHARVLFRAGLLTDGAARRPARRPGQPRRGRRRRQLRTAAHRRGRARRAGTRPDRPRRRRISAGGCGRAGRETTRWPRCFGCGCATRCGGSPTVCSTSWTRWPRRRPRIRRRSCRARRTCSPRSRCCWRIICSHTRTRCCGMSTGSPTSTSGPRCRRTGPGALAGSSLGLDPDAIADELGFDAAADNSIDATAARDFAAEAAFVLSMIARRPVSAGRGHHPLEHNRIRVRHAARLVVDGQLDHAAEEEPRHRGAGPR